VHPIAFKIGSYPLHWYGVLVSLAFLIGLWTASRRGRRDGIDPNTVLDLGPWLIVGAILGARFFYVVSYWREQFAGQPIWETLMIQRGGLVYYGGFIGACLACLIFVWKKRVPVWKLADLFAPSVALGCAFGRLGCFLNGCCYGLPSHLPWAVQFPPPNESYPERVHPTQLYDMFLNLFFYFVLAWLYRKKRFDGQVFTAYLVGYALLRSLVEIFRGDYPGHLRFLGGWATPAHLVSVGILVAGVVLWAVLRKMAIKPAQASRGAHAPR
jgi:phosphatidylglycerol---prolipoprotein diacylglyceryl transferase